MIYYFIVFVKPNIQNSLSTRLRRTNNPRGKLIKHLTQSPSPHHRSFSQSFFDLPPVLFPLSLLRFVCRWDQWGPSPIDRNKVQLKFLT